jgi:hypothetical protein
MPLPAGFSYMFQSRVALVFTAANRGVDATFWRRCLPQRQVPTPFRCDWLVQSVSPSAADRQGANDLELRCCAQSLGEAIPSPI